MRFWFFDFDGTLSAIVPDRTAAQLHPECAAMLHKLTAMPPEQVVIISSRRLDDIAGRVDLPEVIVGGCSGAEWQFPGGFRISVNGRQKTALERARKEILGELPERVAGEGVDIEDKLWSVAIHIRLADAGTRHQVRERVIAWCAEHGLSVYCGPDVLELQLIPGFNKSTGLGFLAGFMKIDPAADRIVYAGDDENDAVAMQWAVQHGGTAIMVGNRLGVPSAIYVPDQQALVGTVQALLHGA